MSEDYSHFTLGTHPVTGEPWAFCLACPSGNGPTIEALRTACLRTCTVTFYDQYGHQLTRDELIIQERERREDAAESHPDEPRPASRIVDQAGRHIERT